MPTTNPDPIPAPPSRAKAIAALLAILTAIGGAATIHYLRDEQPAPSYIEVGLDDGGTVPTTCAKFTLRDGKVPAPATIDDKGSTSTTTASAAPSALKVLSRDAGTGLVYATVCWTDPVDDGKGQQAADMAKADAIKAAMPVGAEAIMGDEFPYVPGMPVLAAYTADSAPWPCACWATLDPKTPCEVLVDAKADKWRPATPDDMSLKDGQYRGSCARQPCSSWTGGYGEIPKECCAGEFDGMACGESRCGHSAGACADGTTCIGHQCAVVDTGKPVDADPGPVEDPGDLGLGTSGDLKTIK